MTTTTVIPTKEESITGPEIGNDYRITIKFSNMDATNHNYYVYILTNKLKTVLYTGVTNNLSRRLYQHDTAEKEGSFTPGTMFSTLFTLNALNL